MIHFNQLDTNTIFKLINFQSTHVQLFKKYICIAYAIKVLRDSR